MATIVTRTAKGSELTFAEVDGNFTNLNADGIANTSSISNLQADKLDKAGGTMTGSLVLNSNLTTNAKVITNNAANSQSGSLVTLTTPGTEIVRLTNVLLTSLAGCQAGTVGQKLILSNRTGTSVTILNESASASTSADQISTGTGADIVLQNNASISLIYDGSLNKWNIIGGTGSGAGSSGINYILNPDASIGTTGYVAYNDGTAAPVDGSGGTPASGLWVRSTTTPLRGSGDFNLVKTGSVSYLGNGVAYDFTIDNADLAKVLTVTFDYEVVSGTYATGDATVYIIQDPAGTPVVIQPAGYQIQSATVGTKMKQIATFQTASNVTSYRLCIHVASASTSDYVLALDSISVGPQVVQYGAPITDWQAFTPTGNWTTNTTYTGYFRRVGDSLEVIARLTLSGAPNSVQLLVNLPSGFSIDTSKITTGNSTILGSGLADDTGVNNYGPFHVYYNNTTSVAVGYTNGTSTWAFVNQASPFTWGNTDILGIRFIVPILGWSSTVQMSNDTDTRIVDLQVNNASLITPSGTIGTSFATATTINFNKTPTKDSHSGYSSGVYTVAVPGDYFVSARLEMSHTASTGSFVGASIAVNGVERAAQAIKPLSPNAYPFVSSLITGLVAGDQITIRLFGDSAAKAFVASIVNDFTVHRLSGPSAIAASETVAARYTNTAGTTITNSLTAVPFATRAYDSHGSFSTPTYTVPVSGKYRVSGVLTTQSVTLATTNDFQVQIFKTGAMVANAFTLGNGAANGQSVQVHTTIDCLAGDTLDVRARISSSVALSTTANNNVICIERIGN